MASLWPSSLGYAYTAAEGFTWALGTDVSQQLAALRGDTNIIWRETEDNIYTYYDSVLGHRGRLAHQRMVPPHQTMAETFGLDYEEMNDRRFLAFDTYEEGKLNLDEYLNRVVFYKE